MLLRPICLPRLSLLPLNLGLEITDYEVLCKLVYKINETIDNLNNVEGNVETHDTEILQLQADVKELQDKLQSIEGGEGLDFYLTSLQNWIDVNLQGLVAKIVKYVFFGLTDDGYFAAYIPDSWNFIRFDTDMDYNSQYYGHLELYY